VVRIPRLLVLDPFEVHVVGCRRVVLVCFLCVLVKDLDIQRFNRLPTLAEQSRRLPRLALEAIRRPNRGCAQAQRYADRFGVGLGVAMVSTSPRSRYSSASVQSPEGGVAAPASHSLACAWVKGLN
jgi:hypothetical protein